MDEATFKLHARLAAMEHLLAHCLKTQYQMAGYDAPSVSALHERMKETLRNETFPGANPALGDALSDEIASQAADVLDAALSMLKEAQGRN